MTLDISIFIIAILILFAGGSLLVRTLTWMGRYLRLSEYFLAFVLVSFATTLPELFVGIGSAVSGIPELSFGNIVGSSVLDITLVLGVVIIISRGLALNHLVSKKDVTLTLGMIMLPAILLLDGMISRIDGAILLFFFVGYIIYLRSQERITTEVGGANNLAEFNFTNFMRRFGLFLAGAVLLLSGSWLVVEFGKQVSASAGLPLFFIGILVGFGTTLPEMVFGVTSVFLRHASMSLGNVFGSILTKFSFVLGLVALIHPIQVSNPSRPLFGLILAGFLIILIQFIGHVAGSLPKWLGYFLLAVALAFLMIETALI